MTLGIIIKTAAYEGVSGLRPETMRPEVTLGQPSVNMNRIFTSYKSLPIQQRVKTFQHLNIRIKIYASLIIHGIQPEKICCESPFAGTDGLMQECRVDLLRLGHAPVAKLIVREQLPPAPDAIGHLLGILLPAQPYQMYLFRYHSFLFFTVDEPVEPLIGTPDMERAESAEKPWHLLPENLRRGQQIDKFITFMALLARQSAAPSVKIESAEYPVGEMRLNIAPCRILQPRSRPRRFYA